LRERDLCLFERQRPLSLCDHCERRLCSLPQKRESSISLLEIFEIFERGQWFPILFLVFKKKNLPERNGCAKQEFYTGEQRGGVKREANRGGATSV
jgi:hypothetical protein